MAEMITREDIAQLREHLGDHEGAATLRFADQLQKREIGVSAPGRPGGLGPFYRNLTEEKAEARREAHKKIRGLK